MAKSLSESAENGVDVDQELGGRKPGQGWEGRLAGRTFRYVACAASLVRKKAQAF
jgi:hypothetical protein